MVHDDSDGVVGPARLHLVAGPLQVGGAPPGDVDGGAALAELEGDAPPDAAARPGDQRHAAVQGGRSHLSRAGGRCDGSQSLRAEHSLGNEGKLCMWQVRKSLGCYCSLSCVHGKCTTGVWRGVALECTLWHPCVFTSESDI